MNIFMISADVSVVAGDRGPFYYMLEGFHRHFDRIDVIGLKPARVKEKQVFGNVHLHHPKTGKLRQPWFISNTARGLLKERDYAFAVSHDYNFFYNGLGAYLLNRKTGLPYISEIHHVPGHPRAASFREVLDRFCTRLYAKWVHRHALAIRVVNAGELPELLIRWGVPENKIRVLHSLYMDFETFCPGETPKEYDLVYCGRLVPNKGIFLILDALRVLKRDLPRIRLLIVGRGPLERKLRSVVDRYGLKDNVVFIEWVASSEELAELYRKSRILVCASFNEGGPRVTVEAMACGTPAVSTPVGIMKELIRHGENGMLFDWDSGALARNVKRLLEDGGYYSKICGNLQETVAPFERDVILAKLAEGFKSLVENS